MTNIVELWAAKRLNEELYPKTILKKDTEVRVPYKGKMVSGKIVRYDKGDWENPTAMQHGPAYVVYIGPGHQEASIRVPWKDVEMPVNEMKDPEHGAGATKGHSSAQMGLRGHSMGDFMPYVIQGKGKDLDSLEWEVLDPKGKVVKTFKDGKQADAYAKKLRGQMMKESAEQDLKAVGDFGEYVLRNRDVLKHSADITKYVRSNDKDKLMTAFKNAAIKLSSQYFNETGKKVPTSLLNNVAKVMFEKDWLEIGLTRQYESVNEKYTVQHDKKSVGSFIITDQNGKTQRFTAPNFIYGQSQYDPKTEKLPAKVGALVDKMWQGAQKRMWKNLSYEPVVVEANVSYDDMPLRQLTLALENYRSRFLQSCKSFSKEVSTDTGEKVIFFMNSMLDVMESLNNRNPLSESFEVDVTEASEDGSQPITTTYSFDTAEEAEEFALSQESTGIEVAIYEIEEYDDWEDEDDED